MNDPLLLIFAAITGLFLVLLIVKTFVKLKFCVLCASISLTWITLLILYWLNLFEDFVLIALLVGNSIVGIYYLVERKTAEKFHIFRLPFFLSLIFVGYILIFTPVIGRLIPTVILLVSLWLIFGFLFLYGHNPKLKSAVSYIINCCKNW